jgi:two-component system NtrC family sensor kinase
MAAKLNCIFTKVLIPFVEREVGSEGVAAVLRTAGRSRDYLMADHNWLPLPLADRLARLSMTLMHEPDEDAWARRFSEYLMEWRPSRTDRHYLGTYSMALAEPRRYFERCWVVWFNNTADLLRFEPPLSIGRSWAHLRWTPEAGVVIPRWLCTWIRVGHERAPTVWGLPPARVSELQCSARGAPCCLIDIEWTNPSYGRSFWGAMGLGALGAVALPLAVGEGAGLLARTIVAAAPLGAGLAAGVALRERRRRRRNQELLDLQSEEIIYSNNQLEGKFRDLEDKIEQLALLADLVAAVNASFDPEKIYDQALTQLVGRMGYERAYLFVAEEAARVLRGHRMAGGGPDEEAEFRQLDLPLDAAASASARAALSGLPVHVNDVATTTEAVSLEVVRALDVRSFVTVPLRVKDRVFGVLNVVSRRPNRFADADVELVAAVANHVALAVDRAESFRTIEELTRGLEDKVRVRTEQLRTTNDELQAAYRDLQATQMQLVQREKMASLGQLVAGVAHELNNPIGFVFSNVATLDDFVRRLRAMLDEYHGVALSDTDRARIDASRAALKVDYALKYVDSMIQGIREGAERARKIVRDLRVFARGQDEVWQSVDLHEEIESSLTLLNHLLKDRITVRREFGALPSVECIRSQIDQVLLNLLANAAQAIAGPGTITVGTRRDGDTAVVTIADSGPGIPDEVIGRIFDPFFTTKPVGEGTGLGLSISYEILQKHGGRLTAESPAGGGAVFTVTLPVARARP